MKTNRFWLLRMCFRYAKIPLLCLVGVTLFSSAVSVLLSFAYARMNGILQALLPSRTMSTLFIVITCTYLFVLLFESVWGNLLGILHNYAYQKIDGILCRLIIRRNCTIDNEQMYRKDFLNFREFMYNNYHEIIGSMQGMIQIVFGAFGVLLAGIVTFLLTEPLMIFYLLFVVCVRGGFSYYSSKKFYELAKYSLNDKIRREKYYRELLSTKTYGKEIRVYNLVPFLETKWQEQYHIVWASRHKRNLKEKDYHAIGDVAVTIADYAVLLILLFSVYRGQIDLAVFTLLFSLARTCSSQVGSIAESLSKSTYKSLTYVGELRAFLGETGAQEVAKSQEKTAYPDTLAYGAFQSLDASHLYFTYPEAAAPVIHDVSFSLRRGEIVSILGYNGSGKTTLSKLLTGLFVPSEGAVALNGVPLTRENRDDMYAYFGIAYQDFARYLLSLRDNVGLGRVEQKDNRALLDAAYQKGNLTHILDKLDEGEDTLLGKTFWTNNADLSGGEWQRVILARAYMGDPEIMVLDEPTASIDPLEELRMLENLRTYLAGRTALLISHRIGFARLADRIVMMHEGRVIEEGTHDALLAKDGYYAALFNSQKELYTGTGALHTSGKGADVHA